MRQVSLREFRTRGSKALENVPQGETVLLAGQQGPVFFLIPVMGTWPPRIESCGARWRSPVCANMRSLPRRFQSAMRRSSRRSLLSERSGRLAGKKQL